MEKITYEQIAAANAAIKTTPIHGKDYAEVNQRIKAFRMVYPDGWINSEMISNDDGICVFGASCGIYTEDGQSRTLGTGHAFEVKAASSINRTSYIENCETSAVGRALGMAGFGIDTSVASAEELQHALDAQEAQNSDEPKQTARKARGAGQESAPQKKAENGDEPLTDEEQAALNSVEIVLKGVTDAKTATLAIKALQAIKHTERSKKLARRMVGAHLDALGLVLVDGEYQQKEAEA